MIWFMDDGDPSLKKRLWNINNGFNGLFMVAIIQFISLIYKCSEDGPGPLHL